MLFICFLRVLPKVLKDLYKTEYNDFDIVPSSDSEISEKNIYSYNLVPKLIANEVKILLLVILFKVCKRLNFAC